MKHDDKRFKVPLYTTTEAANYLGVKPPTMHRWLRGYEGRPPLLTTVEPGGRSASVPFIGLAEGHVLAAIRATGVRLQRVRPALERLRKEIGLEHALASRRLLTDGSEVLYDYGLEHDDPALRELVVVRNNQVVFADVVQQYLTYISYDKQGYAEQLRLPAYGDARVIVDAGRSFGQPIFESTGVRVSDALDLFYAGEPIEVVSEEYGVPPAQIEAALRAVPRAA